MEKTYNLAVVGATGTVGEAILSILRERQFPVREIFLLASAESAGIRRAFADHYVVVQDIEEFDFSNVDIALFAANAKAAECYALKAVMAGCTVIDTSPAFRGDENIPLVAAGVNFGRVAAHNHSGIIASPDSIALQLATVLKPLSQVTRLERINLTTYAAVSSVGRAGVEELSVQTTRLLNSQPVDVNIFPRQIAFNVVPQIGHLEDNGYTREEMNIVSDLRRLLEIEDLAINPTAVQVPVFYGNGVAVHLETAEKLHVSQVRELMLQTENVAVLDEFKDGGYPTPVSESVSSDQIFVGRIREDLSHPAGLNMWIVSDNVRRGAAINAIAVAEFLIKYFE